MSVFFPDEIVSELRCFKVQHTCAVELLASSQDEC